MHGLGPIVAIFFGSIALLAIVIVVMRKTLGGKNKAAWPREFTIHGTDASLIPFLSGTSRITRMAGELKCQGTSASPAPDVYEFAYAFTLTDDCYKNNRLDSVDLAVVVDGSHIYDFNINGIVDSCDRPPAGWFLADIVANGFVNALDYDLFAGLFETACQ